MTTPPQPGEAARLAQQLIDAGFNRRQIADMLARNASLVSQFFSKGKGASLVPALRQVARAVEGGERDPETLRAIAQQNVTRRLTRDGHLARVRGRDVLSTPGGSMAGRAGRQAIAHGADHLGGVIHGIPDEDGNVPEGARLAFTVRMRKRHFALSSGSKDDSPGLRRGVIPRADGTEERSYGSKVSGGFDADEWSARLAAARGDVTAAVLTWLIETGRATEDAEILYLEVRRWMPRR